MSRVRCTQVREAAPELALGLLTGRDRAAYLAHLERCGACRAEVSALAVTADDVLLAGPRSEPPRGFDRRVLDRLAALGAFANPGETSAPAAPAPVADPEEPARPATPGGASMSSGGAPARRTGTAHGRRGWGRRWLAVAAVVLAVVGVVVGGLAGLGALGDRDGAVAPAGATAPMRTGTGLLVGEATARGDEHDEQTVLTVELPGWSRLVERYGDAGGQYWLAVELDDGSRTLDRIPPDHTTWEVPVRAAAGEVAAVSVVDRKGRAWCTGRFPSPD